MNNLPEVLAAWKAQEERVDLAIKYAAAEIALRVKGDAMRNIKGKRMPGEQAISGQPPKNRTGTLRNSILGFETRVGFGVYAAIVGADTVYARAVEMGAPYNPPSWRDGQKFPFLKPAADNFARAGWVTRIVIKHLGAI